ncbi:MAG: NADP-dependent oxidoreductase, partial [Pedobacter sp.]
METTQFVLAERPEGKPTEKTFRSEKVTLPSVKDGELLLRGIYYSVDPYMRGRMSDRKSYVPPFAVDAPIEGSVVAEVLESNTNEIRKGD